ncbi:MAG: hypothetical protein ACTHKZ_02485 [Lysobacteraceae bacterium]
MRLRILVSVAVLALSAAATAGDAPGPPIDPALARAIRAAHDEAQAIGADVWPGYGAAPFGMLVTLPGREVLLCHRAPAQGFSPQPADAITGCDVQARASVFPTHLLAAMPAIDGISTIVMGTPASTGLGDADWRRTLFHEHFHQYQSTFEDYGARLAALDLANGDTSGMWMLEYPFPYADHAFGEAFRAARIALHDAVGSGADGLAARVAGYLKARAALQASVPAKDWRYLELELWYEGVARWTDITLAEHSADPAVRDSGRQARAEVLSALATLDPARSGRLLVYPFGAAEAMLLERCAPGWRSRYAGTMALGTLVDAIQPAACH